MRKMISLCAILFDNVPVICKNANGSLQQALIKKQVRKAMTEKKERVPIKATILRTENELINRLKGKSKEHKMSLNSYVNFVLNSFTKKEEPLFEETINKPERKEIASRSYFTVSEIELLKEYALLNGWSISKEIRYRVISSLAKKPKLNKEELKAIYSVRSSINVLGANINRLCTLIG